MNSKIKKSHLLLMGALMFGGGIPILAMTSCSNPTHLDIEGPQTITGMMAEELQPHTFTLKANNGKIIKDASFFVISGSDGLSAIGLQPIDNKDGTFTISGTPTKYIHTPIIIAAHSKQYSNLHDPLIAVDIVIANTVATRYSFGTIADDGSHARTYSLLDASIQSTNIKGWTLWVNHNFDAYGIPNLVPSTGGYVTGTDGANTHTVGYFERSIPDIWSYTNIGAHNENTTPDSQTVSYCYVGDGSGSRWADPNSAKNGWADYNHDSLLAFIDYKEDSTTGWFVGTVMQDFTISSFAQIDNNFTRYADNFYLGSPI